MQALRYLLFTAGSILLLYSCGEKHTMAEEASRLAERECRAMALREQRFTLANQIRFTQDTMLKAPPGTDTMPYSEKLRFYNSEKERLTNESRLLADTIRQQLDSLQKTIINNPQEQKQFDQLLETNLQQRNCVIE